MQTMKLGCSDLTVPRIAVGCMRMSGLSQKDAERFIRGAVELGVNFFDHADIYGGGQCETVFSEAVHMSPSVRETMILQSKCGIVPGVMFDFSREHILRSADGILSRLRTDYLDLLLLHRPDALCEPEEVAEAFDTLERSGKVRYFGVSNQNPMQIELLKRHVRQPLLCNQLQLSVTNANMITRGTHVNMQVDAANDRDGGILDYCRLNDITVQPWSPFQYGLFEGAFIGSEKYLGLNQKLDEIGERYGVNSTTAAMTWLLRHPARMQPVTGTMNLARLRDCAKAAEIKLTRREWYEIYLAAGHTLP